DLAFVVNQLMQDVKPVDQSAPRPTDQLHRFKKPGGVSTGIGLHVQEPKRFLQLIRRIRQEWSGTQLSNEGVKIAAGSSKRAGKHQVAPPKQLHNSEPPKR